MDFLREKIEKFKSLLKVVYGVQIYQFTTETIRYRYVLVKIGERGRVDKDLEREILKLYEDLGFSKFIPQDRAYFHFRDSEGFEYIVFVFPFGA